MKKGNGSNPSNDSGLDFEAQLWAAADKMLSGGLRVPTAEKLVEVAI